jgi:hypothetical protein
MEIKTKFQVNDIVNHKFANLSNSFNDVIVVFEVLGVLTDTCSAGTQIFYICRPLLLMHKGVWNKDMSKKTYKFVNVEPKGKESDKARFREDELVLVTDVETLKKLKSSQ